VIKFVSVFTILLALLNADGGKGCIEISPYQGGFYQMTEDDYVDPTFDAFYGYIEYSGKRKYPVFLEILKKVKYTGTYDIE